MIFRRTSSGISNQHLFYNVDALVFVEGGESYTKEQVYSGSSSISEDITFWRGIFNTYLPDKRFKFNAIGSKETLRSIADDIEAGLINNIYLALDRDHDVFNNRMLKMPEVVYSYGYSWENDVWNKHIIKNICCIICVISNDDEENLISHEIEDIFDQFINDISVGVCADIYLSKHFRSFFPRENPSYCTCLDTNSKPIINVNNLNNLLDASKLDKLALNKFFEDRSFDITLACYGHLLADFCFKIVVYIKNKLGIRDTVTKNIINRLAINEFLSRVKDDEGAVIFMYYKNQFRHYED